MSRKEDADAFLNMVEDYFVMKPAVRSIPQQWSSEKAPLLFLKSQTESMKEHSNLQEMCSDIYTKNIALLKEEPRNFGVLEKVFLYPIKSCGAFSVTSDWELVSTGLKYDRLWMIVNSSGVCVTQKHNRRLCLIKPHIDLKNSILTLTYEGI